MNFKFALLTAFGLVSSMPGLSFAANVDKEAVRYQAKVINAIEAERIEPTAKEVKKWVATRCLGCHTTIGLKGAEIDVGLISKFGDFGKAGVLQRFVSPGSDPKTSILYKAIESGYMPLEYGPANKSKLPPAELEAFLAAIENWVNAGAPELEAVQLLPTKTKAQILDLAAKDLLQQPQQQNIRYVSLLNLFNNPNTQSSIPKFVEGVNKLLNSLSWAGKIVKAVPVDKEQTLLRIRLNDYLLTAEKWRSFEETILKNGKILHQGYIYGNEFEDVGLGSLNQFRAIQAAVRTRFPIVRADFLVESLSRPPLYDLFVGMPNTDLLLEKNILKIDVTDNIRRLNVIRGGFTDSGVSAHNRVIERHKTTFGGYWKSYDFASSTADNETDIMTLPLGPSGIFDAVSRTPIRGFRHAGGEIIFNLPNGLQAYMLVDNKGNSLLEASAPTEIVKDPLEKNGAVINGISCMRCHDAGMKLKADQIGNLWKDGRQQQLTRDNGKKLIDPTGLVNRLYRPEALTTALKEDTDRFQKALKATGVTSGEPISALTQSYQRTMNRKAFLAEMGLSEKEAEDLLLLVLPANFIIKGELLRADQAGIKRDTFEKNFPKMMQELKQIR